MNKSRFAGGVICLVLSGLLFGLNSVLPPESLMFMIGDRNMPIIPPIVLGIVGIVLLVTAVSNQKEPSGLEAAAVPEPTPDPEKAALNKRLETMAWGFFLIMAGGYMFVPHTVIAKGAWAIGVGLLMLGLNLARYFNHVKMSGFTTVLGIVSIIGGVLQMAGMESIEGALLIIVLGGYLIVKPWFDKRQLFGQAEMS